jgi:hypothetical protein
MRSLLPRATLTTTLAVAVAPGVASAPAGDSIQLTKAASRGFTVSLRTV